MIISIAKKAGYVTIFFLMLMACQQEKQTDSTKISAQFIDKLGKKIDSTIITKMDTEHLPGVAVVVVKDGNIIYKQGYGVANIQTNTKVDPDSTIFRIGSVSKAITMFALTKLIDQGKVNYNDDVTNYFKGIENPYNLQDTLKIKHILTHTGGFDQLGIERQVLDFDLSLEERKAKRESLSEFLNNHNLQRIRPAGQYFTYDTYGTTLAGAIIENVTGVPYPEAMEKLLFQPLGMNLTAVEVKKSNIDLFAIGYGYNNGTYEAMPYEVYKTTPASSIDATVNDMGQLLIALTSNGRNQHGQLFSEEMLHNVTAPQFRPHPEFVGMTHGLWEGLVFGSRPDGFAIRSLGHGGTMLGTRCNLNFIPELNLGIFVVANRDPEAGGGGVSVYEVINIVLEQFNIKKAPLYEVPASASGTELSEYKGNYYQGIFCHTCSENEFEEGAWKRGNAMKVVATNNSLTIGNERYIAREKDIFVKEDGTEMIYFGRNKDNSISFLVSSEDATSFERIDEL